MRPVQPTRTLVVIPTYNEAENILPLARDVLGQDPSLHVLVVDDASPDGTGERVAEAGRSEPRLTLLARTGKLGLGSAYLAGFRHGLEHGYDWVVTMDGDGSHAPRFLPALLAAARTSDLVVGSRYVPGGSVTEWNWVRRGVSRLANRYAAFVLGVGIHDLTAGFNAYRAEALRRIGYDRVSSTGYAFQIELKYRACRAGLRVTELPIKFVDRRHGKSKIPRAQALWTFLRVMQLRLFPPAVGRED